MKTVKKAARFAEDVLHLPKAEAMELATDATSFVWEECKFGRVAADDEGSFWAEVSAQLYKKRNAWRINSLSLDAPIKNTEGEIDGHSGGWNGYEAPSQFDVCYLNQVKAAIELLPVKQREVMRLLSLGWAAPDIAEHMEIPVHTVFYRIQDARKMLFTHDLLAIAGDKNRRVAHA